jgi:hypothetical protein
MVRFKSAGVPFSDTGPDGNTMTTRPKHRMLIPQISEIHEMVIWSYLLSKWKHGVILPRELHSKIDRYPFCVLHSRYVPSFSLCRRTLQTYLKNGIAFSPSGADVSDNESSSYVHKLLLECICAIIEVWSTTVNFWRMMWGFSVFVGYHRIWKISKRRPPPHVFAPRQISNLGTLSWFAYVNRSWDVKLIS